MTTHVILVCLLQIVTCYCFSDGFGLTHDYLHYMLFEGWRRFNSYGSVTSCYLWPREDSIVVFL